MVMTEEQVKAQWTWWRAALGGTIGVVQESAPQSGYYRHFTDVGVAIWRANDGMIKMHVDGQPIEDPVAIGRNWIQSAKNPVTRADYMMRVEKGEWPSNLPALKSKQVRTEDTEQEPERGPGDNSNDLDAYQQMRADTLGDIAEAQAYYARNKITDKASADKASDWGDRLIRASKAAEKARLAENEPLRRQIEQNDLKWKSIVGPAETQGKLLRKLADDWGKAEVERLRKIAEEEAKRKWEAEKAERLRVFEEQQAKARAEREAQAVQEEAAGVPPTPDELEPTLDLPPPPKPIIPEPKLMLGSGQSGNRRSVKTTAPETATIVDLEAATAFYAQQQHPDLIALIQKLADRAIKARASVPGIRFSWETKTEAAE